ncbi:MAG: hypothetical protein IPN63_16430 [Gammaproteobacteria bacterium]|nr:hypothetical protein [Gammaproteobacteria bacterium]
MSGARAARPAEDLCNIMPLNAKLAVAQRLGNWTNTIEAELVDAKPECRMRNEIKTSGCGLFHLRSSYDWQQVRLGCRGGKSARQELRPAAGWRLWGQGDHVVQCDSLGRRGSRDGALALRGVTMRF